MNELRGASFEHLTTVLMVGDYGSGKTEVSVNLVSHLARQQDPGRNVAIADLDLVNPYFRSREAAEPLTELGIRVVIPPGAQRFADLPILLPEVKGLLERRDLLSVLDVGGDDVGSRVLASLVDAFDPSRHALWFVVNANRPFSDTVDGCVRAVRRIEGSSKLRVTGLVSNTHLMDQTTPEMVREGNELTIRVAQRLEIPIAFVAVMDTIAKQLDTDALGAPVLVMQRLMVPPWLEPRGTKAGPELFRIG